MSGDTDRAGDLDIEFSNPGSHYESTIGTPKRIAAPGRQLAVSAYYHRCVRGLHEIASIVLPSRRYYIVARYSSSRVNLR